MSTNQTLVLDYGQTSGRVVEHPVDGSPVLAEAGLYAFAEEEAGLWIDWPSELPFDFQSLSADMLLEGNDLAVFELSLFADEAAATTPFSFIFSLLGECQARVIVPAAALDQHRWSWPRHGAMLKPMCWGAAINPKAVRAARLKICRKAPGEVRVWISRWKLHDHVAEPLMNPLLPKGALVDAVGQSRLRNWPDKVGSEQHMVQHILSMEKQSRECSWPDGWSRWGGWKDRRFEATGFFGVAKDEEHDRWWLVDPEGFAFFSAGVNCVRPDVSGSVTGLEHAFEWLPPRDGRFGECHTSHGRQTDLVSLSIANLIRAFGDEQIGGELSDRVWYQRWAAMTLGMIRSVGFNTVANWSHVAIASKAEFPYVMPLRPSMPDFPCVFRDLPDVYAPGFEAAAAEYASQLEPVRDDSAMIGYFLMNEPNWGFASECPALGMLRTTERCFARKELAAFLEQRYGSDQGLAEAWGMDVGFDQVAQGLWDRSVTPEATSDLERFSTRMAGRFFDVLTRACKAVDPNHLNLGIRYYTVPPAWALEAMKCFDVFSMNAYNERIPASEMERIHEVTGLPLMVGEWHFGALDVGLPGSGIGHVINQEHRGRAYRAYFEDAAAKPWCVGVHWFTWQDQAAWGRFDGENYNIGFCDVCFQMYRELAEAALLSHQQLYEVASGRREPYDEPVEYLPRLF